MPGADNEFRRLAPVNLSIDPWAGACLCELSRKTPMKIVMKPANMETTSRCCIEKSMNHWDRRLTIRVKKGALTPLVSLNPLNNRIDAIIVAVLKKT